MQHVAPETYQAVVDLEAVVDSRHKAGKDERKEDVSAA